jgi:hypothetical protein
MHDPDDFKSLAQKVDHRLAHELIIFRNHNSQFVQSRSPPDMKVFGSLRLSDLQAGVVALAQ